MLRRIYHDTYFSRMKFQSKHFTNEILNEILIGIFSKTQKWYENLMDFHLNKGPSAAESCDRTIFCWALTNLTFCSECCTMIASERFMRNFSFADCLSSVQLRYSLVFTVYTNRYM